MTITVNSFAVLGCGAVAIAGGTYLHDRIAVLRRWLIPAPVIAGLLLAIPTLALRRVGVSLEVDATIQQLAMVALFTSIGFNLNGEAMRRGGRALALLLVMFWAGSFVQNYAGVVVAKMLGEHPLIGIATGAVALAGGPATALAYGPGFEQAGAQGATSAALAAAILGILVAGFTSGLLGSAIIRRDGLKPPVAAVEALAPAAGVVSAPAKALPGTVLLFGLAMGLGQPVTAAINSFLASYGTAAPGYAGAMIAAALIRAMASRVGALQVNPVWSETIGSISLSWFIPLALWTLRYWELSQLAPPILAILAVQLPVTLGLAWVTYRMVGRDFEAAVMASAYFGFMFGTMANSLAAMEELQRRFGPSPRAFLIVPIAGGVLSDLGNVLVVAASRAWFAAG